jgi:Domain of unknown function (DUF4360)
MHRAVFRFALAFTSIDATDGPNAGPLDNRKTCQLNILLHYPRGWQYSIISTTFEGHIHIDAGVSAQQEADYTFFGGRLLAPRPSLANLLLTRCLEAGQSASKHVFIGPQDRDYTEPEQVKLSQIVWSPCGTMTALNMDTTVQVDATGNAQGQIKVSDGDKHITFVVGLQWRTC